MNRLVRTLCAIFAIVAFALAVGIPSRGNDKRQPPVGRFIGVPRDIDWIKNNGWAQIIMNGENSEELICQTKNEQIQRVLLLGLMLRSEVDVHYVDDKSKRLISAKLSIKPKQEQGRVLMVVALDEKDKNYQATILDHNKSVLVWTNNPQMQSILETAMRQAIPVQEFTFDEKTKEITRGKINIALKSDK